MARAEHSEGLRVLCLDGPPFAAAALSEAFFLQQIAHRWAYREDGEDAIEGGNVRVSDMFDIVGGSGIGGLYAILFARLNMTVGQVIEVHNMLVNKLFMADCWARNNHHDCTTAFDNILNHQVHSSTDDDLDSPFFSKDCKKCFISVLNETKQNTTSPRALRTYDVRVSSSPNCTIRQALHATLADLEHLPAVTIGDERFINASSAFPNASRLLVKELASAFPKSGLACFVNLGADNAHPTNDSPMVGQDLMSQFKDLGCFFRLSIRDELHAESRTKSSFWDFFCLLLLWCFFLRPTRGKPTAEGRIKSLVMGYLQEEDISSMTDEIVDAIHGRKQVVKMLRLRNLAGEDGKTELRKDITHLRNEEGIVHLHDLYYPVLIRFKEIKRALKKIRAPDIFQPIREHGCLEGTREDILKPIEDWVEDVDDDTPNVFWLEGYPGTGKTAIAISLKQRLAEADCLGASCFFRREDASQHTLSILFRSLASQLVHNQASIRDGLVQAVNSGDVHLESAPSILFEKLVCGPLAGSVDSASPIVLVLDAMDEFGQSDRERLNLIKLLLPRWIQLPRHCKLFIASRSQGDLPQYLNVRGHAVRRLEVGNATSIETERDIRRFFEHSFEEIRKGRGNLSLWVSSSDLNELVAASAGLFIWASTVVEMVRQMRKNVRQILDDLRERGTTVGEIQMEPLYQLYSTILKPLLNNDSLINRFLLVVICARTPLPATALSRLCELDIDDVEDAGWQLGPVMDTAAGLRFVHKSFVDYVLSHYCPIQLSVNSGELMLTASCFKIMVAQLHFNMGNMPSSFMSNDEVPKLCDAFSEELQYASRFWGVHLAGIRNKNEHEIDNVMAIAESIQHFLYHHFLYWLEVVSILGSFREAMEALSTLKVAGLGEATSDFAQDAVAFLHQFAFPIAWSYPHIYVSALPWAPVRSLVRKRYIDTLPNVPKIARNGDESWPVQLAVIQGHGDLVQSVAFSPDGSQIVSGSWDNTVRIWDATTRQPIGEPLRGHSGYVLSVAFSPNGSQIVSGSGDKTIHIWDATTHQPLGEPLRGHSSYVQSVAFSPDGSQIVSGSRDSTVRIWDAATSQPVGEPLRGHTDWVQSAAFSSDGSQIISGSDDNTVRIWDAATSQPVGEPLRGHSRSVQSVAFSPNGSQIVSGSSDKTVRIWDTATCQPVGEPLRGHSSSVQSVAFSPDGSQIVSGSEDDTVRIWDAATRQPIGEPLRGHSGFVQSVAFSPDGSQIVSGSCDNTVRTWDAVARQPVGETLPGHSSSVLSVAFSPDGSQIVSGSSDKTVRIWDAATCQLVGEPLRGHSGSVQSVAFSPNGSQIVSGSLDETVRTWDAITRQPIGEPLRGHSSSVQSVAFSPDGSQIVSGSDDNTVRIWDASTHQPIGEPLRGHSGDVLSVAFSPDGSQIVSGSFDNIVCIWDTATRQPIGEPLRGHSDLIRSVAFSPNASRIVSGSRDNTVRIWDASTRQPVGEPLRGHSGSVLSVAFSPNGSQIVSGSRDSTVRIWDAATRQPVIAPHTSLKIITFEHAFHKLPSDYFLVDDGWVVDQHNCYIIWIPHHLHEFLPTPNLIDIIGSRGMIVVDQSDMRIGNEWALCVGDGT